MNRHTARVATAAALLGSVVLANYLTSRYGFVPVGFGLTATAGTFAAGGALAARDAANEAWGRIGVIALIVAASLLSALVAPRELATASGVAFLVAELADMLVYLPLRRRGLVKAVLASNCVGAVVDTVLFLWIAYGWVAITTDSLAGQFVGKGWVTLAVITALGVTRAVPRHRQQRRLA